MARTSGGRGSTVPDVEVRSYHDLPVIKAPVWTWEIPTYFWVGGAAGAASVVAVAAEAAGERRLARVARMTAGAGALLSPPLLISDLGVPSRFHHMLRMLKLTSPMSVGSWVLAVFGPAAVAAAGLDVVGRAPRLRAASAAAAAVTGPVLATYTAVLVADTAVPVWHEARRELPALFAASGAASAGAVGLLGAPASGAARAVALTGAGVELVAARVMEHRLGDLGDPYRTGVSGRLQRAATASTAAGAALLAVPRGRGSGRGRRASGGRAGRAGPRGRAADVVGAFLLLAGSLAERWAVVRAGRASALDPAATVRPQRERVRGRTAASG